ETPVRRWDDRPVGKIGAIGGLHQLTAGAVLEKDLRCAGAIRDEDELRHRVVVGWHEEERVMMDRRMIRDLADTSAGGGICRFAAFGGVALTFTHSNITKASSV